MTVTPPVRHLRAADLPAPGADRPTDVAELLPSVLLIAFTRQQELLTTPPKAVSEYETAGIFSRSMELW